MYLFLQCRAKACFMPLNKKLRVSDVYSESEDETLNAKSLTTSLESSILPGEACPKTGIVTTAVLLKDIHAGLYVLVQLPCKFCKKITQYRYVELCQSDIDEDGDVQVQFLKTIDGRRFTEINNDIADVQFDDIIAKLEAPKKTTEGNNIYTVFSTNIDVFEKK